jgi:hypothetical protein
MPIQSNVRTEIPELHPHPLFCVKSGNLCTLCTDHPNDLSDKSRDVYLTAAAQQR